MEETVDEREGHTNGTRHGVAWDNPCAVLRIHRLECFKVLSAGTGNLREIDIARHHDSVRFDGHTRLHRRNVVLTIVVHHVVGSDKGRNVAASFAWKVRINFPIVFRPFGTLHGFGNVGRATVVSRDGECPIVVAIVEFFEIARSCPTRFDGVAAFIDKAVDGESKLTSCGNHKLPQSGGSHATCGGGFERALDDGKIFQFQRQSFGFECFFKDGNIEVLRTEHETHRTA